MKRFIFFARACSCLFIISAFSAPAQELDAWPNYVVIGAFAHHTNAVTFTDDANAHKFPARFEMNPNRNLYYVYVLTTHDREYAIAEAIKLREGTKYFDTWVYSGRLGKIDPSNFSIAERNTGGDFDPRTGAALESVATEQHTAPAGRLSLAGADDRSGEVLTPPGTALTPEPNEDKSVDKTENIAAVLGPAPVKASVAPLTPEEVAGKDFYFHLFRADNLKMIDGEIDAIDFGRSRKMATYPANKPVTVRLPAGSAQQVSFVCQVFGYRKQQKEFDPATPAEDLYLDESGNLVVPFELVRLQKGDIAIMYNVFFFKDAAVMRPESRYEVNNLLELLNENPSYKIRIHGHTNGNASGKIIRMDTPGNFYSLSGTKQGFGSAKALSGERAEVIRQYLVSSGVSEDRMSVKAWGGKKPIHDKHSVRANENVRVEIEILSE